MGRGPGVCQSEHAHCGQGGLWLFACLTVCWATSSYSGGRSRQRVVQDVGQVTDEQTVGPTYGTKQGW